MKKIHILIVSLLMLTNSLYSQNKAEDNYPELTISPFPIMSWVPPALTKQQLGWFEQAGFNVMFIYPDQESYEKLKKHWDGSWMVFKEWNLQGYDYKAMSDFHADDPKRIGFMLGDEPSTPEIDKYVEQYDYLRKKYPEDLCLVNLFPSHVSQASLKSTYKKYMDTFFEKLRPRYVSLDNYPCNRFNSNADNYYHDLEMMRETSQKHNCKTFGFVQVYSSYVARDISPSDLAWQVNSLLAYGSKGLWYFYFRHPKPGINELAGKEVIVDEKKEKVLNINKEPSMENYYSDVYVFGSGVLDSEDNKGERFDDVAEVNEETLIWGNILIKLTNLKVRHILGFKETSSPVGTDEFAHQDWSGAVEKYVVDISAGDKVKSMGYILSYFEDAQKQPYLMIVNKRHGEFMSRKGGKLNTKIAFTNEVKNVYSISNKTSREEKMFLDNSNTFSREITGGGAILLRLELNQ